MATSRRSMLQNEPSSPSHNDPGRDLFEACRNEDLNQVKKLVNHRRILLEESRPPFISLQDLDGRTASILALEKPVETAMLVSVTGVKCLMANQWHCILAENANRLKVNMKDKLEGGRTTDESVRLVFTPYRRRKPEEDKPADEVEEKESHREDERDFSDRDFGVKEEMPEPEMSWYNAVCYGLPNIVVTQLSGT